MFLQAFGLVVLPAVVAATHLRSHVSERQGPSGVIYETTHVGHRHLYTSNSGLSSDCDDDETPAVPSGEGGAPEGEYEYVGCYPHRDWGASSLVYASHGGDMTVDACFTECSDQMATHIALEFGQVCLCGFGTDDEFAVGEPDTCDTQCYGDATSTCGGFYTYDLYRLSMGSTTPPSASPTDPPTASEGTAAPSEKVDPVPATPAPTTTTDPVPQTTAPTTKPDPVPATPAPSGKTDPAPAPTLSPVAPEPTIAPAGSPVAPASTDPPTTSVPGDGSCAPNPCQNGGSCAEDTGGGFICSCTSGFAGMKCQTSTEGKTPWSVEFDFQGTDFNAERKSVFERAAAKWATVIPFVPGGEAPGRESGKLVISAKLQNIDGAGGTLGSAGPTGVWSEFRGISYSGQMEFDSSDIAQMERDGTFEGVILHEMGHVIGVGTLWGECSKCDSSGDAKWYCDGAAEVYNHLKGTSIAGDAMIIELEGGGGTRCGHFSEDIFDDELMTGFVNSGGMPLSKLTCASLEDTGYIVASSMADEYILPANRAPSARSGDEIKFAINDEPTNTVIEVLHPDGTTTTMEGSHMRF